MAALTNVTVTKDGKKIIEDATGESDTRRCKVFESTPEGLEAGDQVTITGDPNYNKTGWFIDENPEGTLNFKIG